RARAVQKVRPVLTLATEQRVACALGPYASAEAVADLVREVLSELVGGKLLVREIIEKRDALEPARRAVVEELAPVVVLVADAPHVVGDGDVEQVSASERACAE